ncbi:MAG TPA: hypothetical protein VGO09_04355 [Flavisolibacter sp.]|nr:hypothetical protein [Flavisolibacter sp.]
MDTNKRNRSLKFKVQTLNQEEDNSSYGFLLLLTDAVVPWYFTIALKEFSASSISFSVKGPAIELLEKIISKGEALVFNLNALKSLIVEKMRVIIIVICKCKTNLN